jgi:hypothetical protein
MDDFLQYAPSVLLKLFQHRKRGQNGGRHTEENHPLQVAADRGVQSDCY